MTRLAARRYNEDAHDAALEYFSFHYHAPFVFCIHIQTTLTRSHRMRIMVALIFKEVS